MSRSSRQPLTIGRKAVAVSIVAELLKVTQPGMSGWVGDEDDLHRWAERIVDQAHDSEYKMRSDQLVLTLDASMEAPPGPDAARSVPLDGEPASSE